MPQFGTKEVFFMSYQQLHAGKVKLNGLAGIRHHLLDRQRVKTNPDIDVTRSKFNQRRSATYQATKPKTQTSYRRCRS